MSIQEIKNHSMDIMAIEGLSLLPRKPAARSDNTMIH